MTTEPTASAPDSVAEREALLAEARERMRRADRNPWNRLRRWLRTPGWNVRPRAYACPVDTLFPELQMYDLIAFATARLAEDKERADGLLFACRLPEKLPDFRACGGPAAEVYWERFEPRRILAEADAKRLVLAEHLPIESMYGLTCKRCVSWQDAPWAEGGETEFGIAIPDPWPCLPVRGAVASWERHPEFKPEWAVDSASRE